MSNKEKTPDRFDLEQQILECWKVTDDIVLFSQDPSAEKTQALKIYYDAKFEQLWATFESLTESRKIL